MIDIPDSFAGDVASSTGSMITQLTPVITLVLGVLLASTVIAVIINALKK